jgi:myo-inositol-hexaphosphate 3-phosphohydrolase
MRFEAGEVIAIWSWDGAHRLLVSIIDADPLGAVIEYGPTEHRKQKMVPYGVLFRRDDGRPASYYMVVDGDLKSSKRKEI